MIRFTDREFELLKSFMRRQYGIDISQKRILAECRLSHEMEEKGCTSLGQYLEQMERDRSGRLKTALLNRLTTNYTYFMREPKHFEFLLGRVLPEIRPEWGRSSYRIWSAGCSSGEECYTLAMLLQEYSDRGGWLPAFDVLGTDISENMVCKAEEARYPIHELERLPALWQRKYCRRDADARYFTLCPQIRATVKFQIMNLLKPTVGIGQYDLILCRNVMIYFDVDSRKRLIDKLYKALRPNGYLFVGHTELLPRNQELFEYVCPAVYRK